MTEYEQSYRDFLDRLIDLIGEIHRQFKERTHYAGYSYATFDIIYNTIHKGGTTKFRLDLFSKANKRALRRGLNTLVRLGQIERYYPFGNRTPCYRLFDVLNDMAKGLESQSPGLSSKIL